MYTGVPIDSSHRLRKIFNCVMGAKRAGVNVDLGKEEEDTPL